MASGWIVVAGHVDDWHVVASSFEIKPQIDTRSVVVQVDVQNDAKSLLEVAVIFERLGSRKKPIQISELP